MQLVGAPFAYVRGPFVVEGILQGGAGALLAILLLWASLRRGAGAVRRSSRPTRSALGTHHIPADSSCAWLLVAGGMLLGCVGGLIVARGVR